MLYTVFVLYASSRFWPPSLRLFCLGIGWSKDKDKPASSLHRKGFPVCPYCAIRALLRRGLHPFWGRYQDGARQSRTRHRRLYPGRVRARHRPNEAGAPPPYGELHQGRFRPVREKRTKKPAIPCGTTGFLGAAIQI